MKQPSNVVKSCKNNKCQHVFVFKSKKSNSMQGRTTKKCPECAKHALSNSSDDCSDPTCGYKFLSGLKKKIKPNKKKTKRKPKKSKKVKAKIGHKRKNTVRVSKPFDLYTDFEPQVENTPNSGLLFQTNSFSLLGDFSGPTDSGPTELTRSNPLTPILALSVAQVDNDLIGLSSGLLDAPAKLARGNSLSLFAKAMPKLFEPVAFDYYDQELPDATFSQNVYENEEQAFSDFSTFFESSNEITWNMTTPTV